MDKWIKWLLRYYIDQLVYSINHHILLFSLWWTYYPTHDVSLENIDIDLESKVFCWFALFCVALFWYNLHNISSNFKRMKVCFGIELDVAFCSVSWGRGGRGRPKNIRFDLRPYRYIQGLINKSSQVNQREEEELEILTNWQHKWTFIFIN